MGNSLSYKGYTALVEFDAESGMLFGSVAGIRDGIFFEGRNADEMKQFFQEAVDDYLSFCKEKGKEPERPFKGSFNVRIGPELHEKAALAAAARKQSLNQFVAAAIAAAL
ncbi:MAG: type II toxin-antitoxin system HicB family antitoxin [Eggerthellaceae bacterium]|nr:type II toxin-antitoxin system HicB family antitoxin [Eggerthellaceae bacterium]